MLAAEEIEANFGKFRGHCESLGERKDIVLEFVDFLGTKLAMCPASTKYHMSVPGGLVKHSLNVLENAVRLRKAFKWQIPDESLIITSLFHDIGKIGLVTRHYHYDPDYGSFLKLSDFYVDSEEWKQQKYGTMYDVNKEANTSEVFMSTPQRSIFNMQSARIELTREEYLGILLNDGWVVEDNRSYCLKVPPLVIAIQTADYVSTCHESGLEGF